MENLILTLHIIASLGVIGLTLVQHGKGADAGPAFGGGNSESAFGVQGAANFLSRSTSIFVTAFFCTSIALALIAIADFTIGMTNSDFLKILTMSTFSSISFRFG